MPATITLRSQQIPSVQESSANVRRILDLLGTQERLRQDRQSLSDFVSENLRLQGENAKLQPEFQLSPDEISQRAALSVTQKDPQFAKGLQGVFQKFASGLTQGPSTALTGPIAEGLLKEPTGIRRELIRSQIEANRARRTGAARKPGELTAGQKQRDRLVKIIADDETPSQRKANEARQKLKELPKEDLFNLDSASKENIDKEFSKAMKGLGGTRVQAGPNPLDKKFGAESYKQGLKKAIDVGLEDGVDPDAVEEAFNTWWDEQFLAEKGQVFQKFRPRSAFQEIESEFEPEPETKTGTDISAQIEKALKAGTITQAQKDKIEAGLLKDPTKAEEILQALSKQGTK